MAFGDKSTYFFKQSELEQKWFVVDANGQTLGRLATEVARILRGKHKPSFTPNADAGDFVVIINAEKIRITGKRAEMKEYFRYSGYPGGQTFAKYKDVLKSHPERILEHAVRGMIPHTRLGRKIFSKLKVYAGPEHPHASQKPAPLSFN
ncbi:MAG: 50S ribosomal protein L13 [Acidobacteriota bacterium]